MLNSTTGPYLSLFLCGLFLSIVSLIAALVLPRKSFRRFHQAKRYSFLNDFPFELFEAKDRMSKAGQSFFFGYVAFAAFFSAFPLFLVRFGEFHGLTALFILHLLLTLGELGLFLALTFIPAYDAKRHMLVFTFYSGITLIRFVVDTLAVMNLGKMFPDSRMVAFGFMVPILVLALLVALLLMSPKMGKWAELHSTMNEDGSTVTSRPRFFILAASEWATFFATHFCSILFNGALLAFAFILLG